MSQAGEADLIDAATRRLRRPVAHLLLRGRVEHEVVRAAEGADLLVCARDGDRSRLGPHSIGPATRFVVDHAPCDVLLVWPDRAPGLVTLPPSPPEPPRRPPQPHPPPG
jgi:nucleotide-binding universal stress UspA family protein